MHKLAPFIAAAMTLAGAGSLVTNTKLATPTDGPKVLMPLIEQMTLAACDWNSRFRPTSRCKYSIRQE
jgi:hypothetical protein